MIVTPGIADCPGGQAASATLRPALSQKGSSG
jgi:hypothetical protein